MVGAEMVGYRADLGFRTGFSENWSLFLGDSVACQSAEARTRRNARMGGGDRDESVVPRMGDFERLGIDCE